MAKQFTQEEIKAMPDATFNEIWWGDFIKTIMGEYEEIICLSYVGTDNMVVTTIKGTVIENPKNYRFKKNPVRDYSGSP